MKRTLILADMHCGHRVGLTPPGWQYGTDVVDHRAKYRTIQAEHWEWYEREIRSRGPFDVIVSNGDAIDGKGYRSGGTEQIEPDRNEQILMAAKCIHLAQSKATKKTIIVRGTPYHTGSEEDFEDLLGGEVNAFKVGNHEWIDVDGVIIDCKHKIGGSQIPHGRYTAIAREQLWNMIWAERDEAPRASIIVRSHVHYYAQVTGPNWTGLTTPALQGLGSKYGARECSGVVDFGFVVIETDKGTYNVEAVCGRIKADLPGAIKV